MPTHVHDGLTLWYEESGSGAPVIFIAGTMSDHTTWDVVVPQLRGLRSITPDNRDIGNSSMAKRDYTVREMAGDVLALMGHLDLERASIVGHSLGGKIAQEVALLARRGSTSSCWSAPRRNTTWNHARSWNSGSACARRLPTTWFLPR